MKNVRSDIRGNAEKVLQMGCAKYRIEKQRKMVMSFLLCFTMLVCSFTTGIASSVPTQTSLKTTLIACSDFQAVTGNEEGKNILRGILDSITDAGINYADGFFCCGDYDYEYSETTQGINAIKDTIGGVVSENMVFVQGNHDSSAAGTGINHSGNNDPESGEYGVFVINEDDYMWHNNNEATIKQTAQNLIEYLNDKISVRYDRPIFVLSHLPLNYSMRTKNDGDGMHANYIFDALNQAGQKGLNIIYLFGHDHSNGWDDYLGGSAIFLKKGDNILIAQNSKTVFQECTLNFTYMNAGYIGYYKCVNDGVDGTLTMSVLEITDDTVSVSRYDSQGVHNLKSAGVTNAYKGETGYEPNKTIYNSPQTIELTSVIDIQPIPDLIEQEVYPEERYVRVTSSEFLKDGGQYLIVYNSSDDMIMLPKVNANVTDRIGFDLESSNAFGGDVVKGHYSDKLWTFTKTDNDGWLIGDGEKYAHLTNTQNHKVTATLEETGSVFTIGGNADAYTFSDGTYVLNYNSRGLINGYSRDPASFYIYEYIPEEQYVRITSSKFLKDGGQYLIVYNSSDDMIMLPKVNSNVTERIGFDLENTTAFGGDVVKGNYLDKLWTFTKADNDGWLIGDGEKYAKLANTQNYRVTATLEETGSVLTIGGNADAYTFSDGTYVLNYNSRGLINGYSRDPATFYIYEYFPGVKPITKTSVTSTESSVNIEVVLDNVNVGSSLMVVGYEDDRLEAISHIITTSKTTESVSLETFVDTVKVFVWESIPSMKPITTVETVSTQLGK